jgi:hypothetical protein
VVLTDLPYCNRDAYYQFNNICREKGFAIINSFQTGLFGYIFNDFGAEFTVLDKDGEEL